MMSRIGEREGKDRTTKSKSAFMRLAVTLAAGVSCVLLALIVVASAAETVVASLGEPGEGPDRRSLPPLMAAVSEGSEVTFITEWQWAGLTGRGVKVGVLDLGFLGYARRIAEGELPADVITRSFVSDGSELAFWGRPPTAHGTACAEVVYDVAPDAQLYLVNFGSEAEWAAAVDWLLAQEVNVISFSGGWPLGGPGDGTGTLAAKVGAVRGAGVLWINAAGNAAQQHWMGEWRDDGPRGPDGWHDFGLTDGTNAITVTDELAMVVGLRWDDPWGGSANDYDLFLFREEEDGSLREVARSEWLQDGDDDPLEVILYAVPESGVYHLAVSRQPGAATRTLELFSYYHAFEHQTATSSLVVPADSQGSLTVGATYWQQDALEQFSSQGPTRDGRAKPDLSAPDGVSVSTESYAGGFYGTSASAPHVAGAAALVLEAFPTYTPAQVQDWLEDQALDMGEAGRDNAYGAGRLHLGAPPFAAK
jgi:subtilisin family serine protease